MTETVTEATILHMGWLSLLPAVLTVVCALAFKRVIESLLLGIAVSAFLVDQNASGWFHAILYSVPNTFAMLAGHAPTETLEGLGLAKSPGRPLLLIAIIFIGSLITLLDRSGGAFRFGEKIAKRIKGERGALVVSWLIGICIFTSAYFGALVTGAIMRPIYDKMKISREKLSYYCDTLSAPSKAFIPFSGWIAYMVILIEENIPVVAAGDGLHGFIQTMPYNLYCIFSLLFALFLAFGWIKDFGPMKKAERRVKEQGLIHEEGSKPMLDPKAEEEAHLLKKKGDASDMLIPLLVSILVLTVLGMWNPYFVQWFSALPKLDMDSLMVMAVAFAFGILTALIQYKWKGLMRLREGVDIAIEGGKSAIIGAAIIAMAVTLGDVMKASSPEGLGTAPFLIEVAGPFIVAAWIPALTFLIGAILSFTMGTSWGVWAIMMPISIPLALQAGMNPFIVAGAVLSSGAFGDHCSPISDTSVMSSLAANTDHLQHIRTQLPYAVVVGVLVFVLYLGLGFLSV